MANMDKIVNDIILEAKAEAQKIIDEANAGADRLTADARNECVKIRGEAEKQAQLQVSKLKKRMYSARASLRREALLKAKHDIIESEITKVCNALTNLPQDEYYSIIIKLLTSVMREGKCVIYFSPEEKLPSSVSDKISQLAAEKKCEYTVSHERADVRNGFILVYGGIEENYTFQALIEAKRGELYDTAAQILFGMEENV